MVGTRSLQRCLHRLQTELKGLRSSRHSVMSNGVYVDV